MAEAKANARSSRESQSHDNTTRRKPWRPVRSLETPTPPEGYTYRWIRSQCWGKKTEQMSRADFVKVGNS